MSDETPKLSAARVAAEMFALRAQCVATAKLVELILAELGYGKSETTQTPTVDESGACLHPKQGRRPAPVMGKPYRYFCGACEEVVNE